MIGILGDIHGGFGRLREAHDECVAKGAVALIQVGDFGFEYGADKNLRRMKFELPILVIDGNHDNFVALRDHVMGGFFEYSPGITYMGRGTFATIDGRVVGFLGGAGSIDKDIRLRAGWLWQPDENITDEDAARTKLLEKVDILVTHCPPQSVITKHFETDQGRAFKTQAFGVSPDWTDPSAAKVEDVWNALGQPPLYCGHMHRSVEEGNVRILNIDELVFV